MGTTVVTLCGLCGKPVVDFFYKVRTNEGDKALCLDCAGANTIQQLSDIGFIDAPEEIADAPLYDVDNPESPLHPNKALDVLWEDAKKRHGLTDEAEEAEKNPVEAGEAMENPF